MSDKVIDDGSLEAYRNRLEIYYKQLEKERELLHLNDTEDVADDEHVEIMSSIKIPAKLWKKLYE